jgi:hypothetical protein
MRELSVPVGPFGITSLWQACSDYSKCNQDSIYDSQIGQMIAEGAALGGFTTNESSADADFESNVVHFVLTAADRAVLNLGAAICGRPEIEGCMVCQKYGIKLHLIEKPHSSGQEVISHQLVDSSGQQMKMPTCTMTLRSFMC